MYLELFIKYLHFLCIFAIIGSLVGEHLLLKEQMMRKEIRRLFVLDGIYGLSAVVLLFAGFSLWFWVGKPADFYSKNPTFHLKIGLFVIVGLLSVYPSIFFWKNRKGNEDEVIEVPKKLKMFVRIELLLLFIMPFLATAMARGINLFE